MNSEPAKTKRPKYRMPPLQGALQVRSPVLRQPGPHVLVYTDGSCWPNPGPGGWAAILRYGTVEKEIFGGERATTNNRMEMMAAIMALEMLTRPCRVRLYTDSQYLRCGAGQWIKGWKKKGWKGIKNPELWQRLDAAVTPHDVEWYWVRGHDGHPENERADALAETARLQVLRDPLRPKPQDLW